MRLIKEKTGSVAIETAIILPLMALLLFASVDLSRIFSLRLQMDEHSNLIASYIAQAKPAETDAYDEIATLLSLKSGFENANIQQIYALEEFTADGFHRHVPLYVSNQDINTCLPVQIDMAYDNTNNISFFPNQKRIQVSICASPNENYFLAPVLRALDVQIRSTGFSPISVLSWQDNQ